MSSAFAGVAGSVDSNVEALSGTVTYSTAGSKGQDTKVGYKVTITRVAGFNNTVNNVVFEGATSIIAASGTPSLPGAFVEANDDGGAVGKVPIARRLCATLARCDLETRGLSPSSLKARWKLLPTASTQTARRASPFASRVQPTSRKVPTTAVDRSQTLDSFLR